MPSNILAESRRVSKKPVTDEEEFEGSWAAPTD
jgi:hypothetical protein